MTKTTSLAAASVLVAGLFATAAGAQTVAFLMPDQASTRYEEHDWPGFQVAMGELCPDCTLIYQNGNADVALQQQQFNSVIAQGASVVVLDPVDSAAAAALVEIAKSQDVRVVAYDRPIPDSPADFYVSFDNEGIGYAIAQSLVEHLEAEGVPAGAGVLQINGSPTDAAAGLIRDGIDRALDASPYVTMSEFDTPDWAPPRAQEWAAGQITRFGNEIRGIVAANDGTGGGAWHRVTLSVVTSEAGFHGAKEVAAAINDALTDAQLSLSRGRLTALHFYRARARREGTGDVRRIDLTFRARVDDTL